MTGGVLSTWRAVLDSRTALQKKSSQLKKAERALESFTRIVDEFRSQDMSAFEGEEDFKERLALIIKRQDRMLRGMVKAVKKYRGQVEELRK